MSSALLEFNPEAESLEQESFEASGLSPEAEESVLDESQEMELASGLLEITREQGIARYIDQLITSVAQSCRKPIPSLARRELSRLLREAAGRVLPALEPQRPLQTRVSSAARLFGLELEGLSNEDREFETVKAFIRLAESASRRLANEPHGRSPEEAARNALAEAAKRHAPGLLAGNRPPFGERAAIASPQRNAGTSLPIGDPTRVAPRGNALIPKESTMHNIDRTALEYGQQESQGFETGQFGETGMFGETGVFGESEQFGETGQFETSQGEWSGEGQYEVLGEAEQVELAAELLSVSNEGELDRFLGDLVKKVGQYAGQAIRSPVGQALIPVLKSAAAKALPLAGRAVGTYFGGPLGAQIGTGLANAAGQALGLESEALSHEDREFEGAKQFVKLAAQTVQNAASAPPNASPTTVAQQAAVAAAKALAPALLSPQQPGGPRPGSGGQQGQGPSGPRASSGRWVRKGKVVVLLGA